MCPEGWLKNLLIFIREERKHRQMNCRFEVCKALCGTGKDLTVQLHNDSVASSAHSAPGTVPITLCAPWHWHHTTAPVHRSGNQSSTGIRCLPRMIQLISMRPEFQPTSVCAQNRDWFHSVRLPTEEETEASGRSLEELAWGS